MPGPNCPWNTEQFLRRFLRTDRHWHSHSVRVSLTIILSLLLQDSAFFSMKNLRCPILLPNLWDSLSHRRTNLAYGSQTPQDSPRKIYSAIPCLVVARPLLLTIMQIFFRFFFNRFSIEVIVKFQKFRIRVVWKINRSDRSEITKLNYRIETRDRILFSKEEKNVISLNPENISPTRKTS